MSEKESHSKDKKANQDLQTAKEFFERCQEQLHQTEQMKILAIVASSVVHDIRNSLGVISSTAQFVLNKIKPNERERQAWELVERNVETIKNILTNYLGLTRQSKDSRELSSINEIVERVCGFIDTHARHKNIKVTKHFDETIPPRLFNVPSLESSILNICLNSIDAMEHPGTLKLSTKQNSKEKKMILEIEDTGHGISPEHLDKIFMPFFTTKQSGTGLGLYSAKISVEKDNGTITCQSVPHKGTKMIIQFPLNAEDIDGGS